MFYDIWFIRVVGVHFYCFVPLFNIQNTHTYTHTTKPKKLPLSSLTKVPLHENKVTKLYVDPTSTGPAAQACLIHTPNQPFPLTSSSQHLAISVHQSEYVNWKCVCIYTIIFFGLSNPTIKDEHFVPTPLPLHCYMWFVYISSSSIILFTVSLSSQHGEGGTSVPTPPAHP